MRGIVRERITVACTERNSRPQVVEGSRPGPVVMSVAWGRLLPSAGVEDYGRLRLTRADLAVGVPVLSCCQP